MVNGIILNGGIKSIILIYNNIDVLIFCHCIKMNL